MTQHDKMIIHVTFTDDPTKGVTAMSFVTAMNKAERALAELADMVHGK